SVLPAVSVAALLTVQLYWQPPWSTALGVKTIVVELVHDFVPVTVAAVQLPPATRLIEKAPSVAPRFMASLKTTVTVAFGLIPVAALAGVELETVGPALSLPVPVVNVPLALMFTPPVLATTLQVY